MINFRDREDMGPAVIATVSIVALLGGFAFMVFFKPPTTQAIAAKAGKSTVDLKRAAKASNEKAALSQVLINKYTWTGDAEYINTTALQTATKLAEQRGLKLTVFRTQRPALVDNLVSLPYVITVEGPYLGALNFARDLEDPKTKLAVTQIQVSSSDPNTDKVTANVGIAAYVNPKEAMPIDTSSSTLQTRRGGNPRKEEKNA